MDDIEVILGCFWSSAACVCFGRLVLQAPICDLLPCPAPVPRLQAWFPAHAEIWNAPTWFLSALTFAMVVLPHVLPAIAGMRRKGLSLLLGVLTLTSLAAKVSWGRCGGAAEACAARQQCAHSQNSQ